jgi:hypothetical protein
LLLETKNIDMRFLSKCSVALVVLANNLMAMEEKDGIPTPRYSFKFEQTMHIASIPDDIASLNVDEARKAATFYKTYLNATWLMMEQMFAAKILCEWHHALVNPDAEDKEVIGGIIANPAILQAQQEERLYIDVLSQLEDICDFCVKVFNIYSGDSIAAILPNGDLDLPPIDVLGIRRGKVDSSVNLDYLPSLHTQIMNLLETSKQVIVTALRANIKDFEANTNSLIQACNNADAQVLMREALKLAKNMYVLANSSLLNAYLPSHTKFVEMIENKPHFYAPRSHSYYTDASKLNTIAMYGYHLGSKIIDILALTSNPQHFAKQKNIMIDWLRCYSAKTPYPEYNRF